MTAESAVRLLGVLNEHNVDSCVGGGWAVDALLGTQTRDHSDLDLWIRSTDIGALFVAFAKCALDRILPWPGDRPWNFVLHDGGRLRVDLHFYEIIPDGRWHYGSVTKGESFPAAALGAHGTIADTAVRCEAPEWSVRWHTQYLLRDVDRHDIPLLCERFGIGLPEAYR
jgi:lincosamide nucleotidyltransferase A/C/D/E